jgi:hypothetical protein
MGCMGRGWLASRDRLAEAAAVLLARLPYRSDDLRAVPGELHPSRQATFEHKFARQLLLHLDRLVGGLASAHYGVAQATSMVLVAIHTNV